MNPCANAPCLSLSESIASYTRAFTSTAEIGRWAPERALAQVTMSGRAPYVSDPHMLPVRPKPQITSSAMNSTSYLSSTAWMRSK